MLSPSVIPPAFDAGSVRLVSAGPGGQKLLALRAVQKAAIILDATRVSGEIFSVPAQAHPTDRAGADRSPGRQRGQNKPRGSRTRGKRSISQRCSCQPRLKCYGNGWRHGS
jgi:siroheme synthase